MWNSAMGNKKPSCCVGCPFLCLRPLLRRAYKGSRLYPVFMCRLLHYRLYRPDYHVTTWHTKYNLHFCLVKCFSPADSQLNPNRTEPSRAELSSALQYEISCRHSHTSCCDVDCQNRIRILLLGAARISSQQSHAQWHDPQLFTWPKTCYPLPASQEHGRNFCRGLKGLATMCFQLSRLERNLKK